MRVGLHTVDLFPGRERLMPFRTILEVARIMQSQGYEVTILNSVAQNKNTSEFEWNGISILQCPRRFDDFSQWVNEKQFDVIFFATTIRDGLRNLHGLIKITCKKIAYIPSGITPKKNAIWLGREYGLYAKAWLLEAFTPKRLLTSKLKKAGFNDIICLTDYTSRKIGNHLRNHVILPGKDEFEEIQSDEEILKNYGLENKKFILYTGGPAEVRGCNILLRAFDDMVSKTHEGLLVVLMRNDVGAEYEAFDATYDSLRYRENVLVTRKHLTRKQLKAFMSKAYAVVLPFICIPAEIPLTYYEVLSCGTPVISFSNGGTTEYLKDGLFLSESESQSGLTNALAQLWQSESLRSELSGNAKQLMAKHPVWEDVASKWIKTMKNQ